jgi:hypothetical protein
LRDTVNYQFTYERTVADTGILQSGPALVASNVKWDSGRINLGNMYVVAVRTDGRMQLFWRYAKGDNFTWIPSEIFGENIPNTPPVMIEDYWRTDNENMPGGFQLCVAKDGQIQHWQRINTGQEDIWGEPPKLESPGKWGHVFTFGQNIRHVWSLMHGAFNGQLELVAEDYQGRLWHWSYVYPGTWVRQSLIPDP